MILLSEVEDQVCLQDVTLPGIDRLEGAPADLPSAAEEPTAAASIASGTALSICDMPAHCWLVSRGLEPITFLM